MQLPSNKVGLVLIVVVLVVVGTLISSRVEVRKPLTDLQNVELLVTRNTDSQLKSGDGDADGLADWLEEFYHTDKNNPDSDEDGTTDGAEVEVDRDPTVPGPNDPLITQKDLVKTEVNMDSYKAGTATDKASIELFSQYLMLKKQGTLKPEDEAKLVDDLSRKVAAEASLKDIYSAGDLKATNSTNETLTVYGDRVAQVSLAHFLRMDSYKNFNDSEYLIRISSSYKSYADELLQISVPGVTQELHLLLVNYAYKTGVLFEVLAKSQTDPISGLVVISQYQALPINEQQLYTSLGTYFKNNDILFDTESTIRFWKNFQN